MPDVLIFADSVVSPEMRHEVPVMVPDPFLYAEKNGKRYAAASSFEVAKPAIYVGEVAPEHGFEP